MLTFPQGFWLETFQLHSSFWIHDLVKFIFEILVYDGIDLILSCLEYLFIIFTDFIIQGIPYRLLFQFVISFGEGTFVVLHASIYLCLYFWKNPKFRFCAMQSRHLAASLRLDIWVHQGRKSFYRTLICHQALFIQFLLVTGVLECLVEGWKIWISKHQWIKSLNVLLLMIALYVFLVRLSCFPLCKISCSNRISCI